MTTYLEQLQGISMAERSTSTLASNVDFCRNFPPEPELRLPREQLYEVIKKTLEAHRIVVLEGEPLSGKTECLADFMRRTPDTCIGIFLNPDLGIFHSPSYLRLVVAEQISWIIEGVKLLEDSVTEERYRQLLFKLQRHAKHNRITWLIDGLSDSRNVKCSDVSELVRLIPFGMREFAFVITAEHDLSETLKLQSQVPKIVPLFPVGLEEATSYFADLNVSSSDIQEIRHFSSGVIGRMQKFRDFLKSSVSFESLLLEQNASLETLFEFEWKLIPKSDATERLLAYVAFSIKPVTVYELSKFLGDDLNAVRSRVNLCRILTMSPDGEMVSIESRAQRSFCKIRLKEYEQQIRSYVITTLLEAPASKDATMYLPTQLMEAGRHDELLTHLGPNHFLNLLETEHSLVAIRRHAEIGIHAARTRENPTAQLSLSLIKSTATGLTFSIGSDSQIEALIKLGSIESALELASIAPTTEERLHLLANAANSLHMNNQAIPDDLKAQIRNLKNEVSFDGLGELGVEIACNLLPVEFDTASDIMKHVLDGARKRLETSSDTQIDSKRTGTVDDRRNSSSIIGEKNFELIPEYQMLRFADAVATTVEKFSPERITAFIKGIEPSNKITVLARWLGQNREHEGAFNIAELALNLVLSEVSRTPRLQDLRELAEILPHIKDESQRDSLARRIEAQTSLLGHQGTSVEFSRLKLLLLSVYFIKEPSQVELSLIELFAEIVSLKEVSVKTTCFTWMLHYLTHFPNSNKLEEDTGLISEVTVKLSESIDSLLKNTANHFRVARAAILALAQTNAACAFQLVGRLNTVDSRDSGYEELARGLVVSNLDDQSLPTLKKAICCIVDDSIRNRVSIGVLRALTRKRARKELTTVVSTMGDLWTMVRISSVRLQALTIIYRLRLIENKDNVDTSEMRSTLLATWNNILIDSVKVELGYWVASELSNHEPSIAQEWIQRSVDFSKERHVPSEVVQRALLNTISLAVRVFPHVNDIADEHYNRILSLIRTIPSTEFQLQLLTRLGIRLHYAGKGDTAKRIVADCIEPIINHPCSEDSLFFDSAIAYAAPLLYIVHAASAIQIINKIRMEQYRDIARSNICTVLLRRCPTGEPFDDPEGFSYDIQQSTVADILAVLEDIQNDSTILSTVQALTTSISSDNNKSRITRNLAVDYLDSIGSIVGRNLPDKNNIQHNGYKVACLAYILRARASIQSTAVRKEDWVALYSDAQSIDNVADKVVVMAIVGSCAQSARATGVIGNWIPDVLQHLSNIPSDQDRIDRYEWIAKIASYSDRSACRTILSDAIKQLLLLPETDDVVQRQRSIFDLAHSIDPKLAEDLIKLNDTDDARKASLEKEKKKHDIRLTLARNPSSDEIGKMTDEELADAHYEYHARLSAGRLNPRSIGDFAALQKRASRMPIDQASSIWHYITESSLKKRSRDRDDQFALKLFDATCKSSEIVCGLVGKFFSGEQRNRTLDIGIIRNGDRELFIERLREWAIKSDHETIRISDPYFGPEDIHVVKTLAEHSPGAKYRILTSREHIRKKAISEVGEAFEDAWQQICDDLMPEVHIAVVGIGNIGKHPIHDRWIVSESGGLRLGTSAHSMGSIRTSEISLMTSSECLERCEEIDSYMDNPPRQLHGEKVSFSRHSL